MTGLIILVAVIVVVVMVMSAILDRDRADPARAAAALMTTVLCLVAGALIGIRIGAGEWSPYGPLWLTLDLVGIALAIPTLTRR